MGDYMVGEAAGMAVVGATWRELPGLGELMGSVGDAEVKGRVAKRVEEIEEGLAFDPPPISVDLKEADYGALAAAWERETGMAWRATGRRQGTFTLKMTDKPLWEVFLALNRQHSVWMLNGELLSDQPRVVTGDVEGGLLFYPSVIQRQLDSQDAEKPAQEVLSYFVLADPRMKVVRYRQPQVTSVVDDLGNELYSGPANAQESLRGVSSVMMQAGGVQTFPVPAGKKVTVEGTISIAVAVAERTVELKDVEKQGAAGVVLAGVHYGFDAFDIQGGQLRFTIAGKLEAAMVATLAGAPPVRMKLVDGEGNVLLEQVVRQGTSGVHSIGNVKGPVKAVFTVAVREKERTVLFRFKDLAVP
jgi:hypothetical protein